MRSDQDEMAEGLRLAAIAIVSALATATLVIGGGQVFIRTHAAVAAAPAPEADSPMLIRTSN